MHNIPAKTTFLGHHRLNLPTCHSTNDVAARRLREGRAYEGTVVVTDHQTAGRGQRGRTWESEAGLNLLFSLVLQPTFLRADQQFLLGMAVATGVHAGLTTLVQPASEMALKWPNDVYYGTRKLGGMLLENTVRQVFLQHTIVGIGLNVNQLDFATPAATSLRHVTGTVWEREQVLQAVLQGIEQQYLQLRRGHHAAIRARYLHHLYRYRATHPFRDAAGRAFSAQIEGVSPEGHLLLREGTHLHRFGVREVTFL